MSTASGSKVLVIDDDPACRRLLRVWLTRAGFDVTEATDGVEGFEQILASEPSLVISDWDMPRMNGLDLIRRIRETELAWYPYMLLMTASLEERQAMETGADDFISKPLREDLLLPRIRAGQRIMALQHRLGERNQELNDAVQQLSSLAVRDPLTGLFNRRAALDHANREWRRSQRYNLPLSCLMCDIDFFKKINDTYGHPVGDAVIRTLGTTLSQRFRATDVLSRHGGEEFCILLVETTPEKAELLAERLLEQVRAIRMPEISEDFHFSISCGVSSRTLDMLSVESLIDQADQALLMAKKTGRDRYVCFENIELLPSLMEAQIGPSEDRSATLQHPAMVPFQVVNTLLAALRHRDPDTVEHTQRVATTCREFGQFLGLDPDERTLLEVAALLHDVGKLTIPDAILTKTGRLSDEEFAVAQQHHEVTIDLLNACFTQKRLVEVVQNATRWFDGSRGKPAGEEIPLPARILSIASFYDDVSHGRGWWNPHDEGAAIERIGSYSGTQFDPQLVDRFCALRISRRMIESSIEIEFALEACGSSAV